MMVKEDQDIHPQPAQRRGRAFQAAAVAVTLVSLAGMGFFMLRLLQPVGSTGGTATADAKSSRLFRHWPQDRKPDLVLVLSGQQHGYIQPCGCSSPQYGGLARRYNFLQELVKERGWSLVALDLGDVAQKNGPQAKLKYRYSMEALKLLDYSAVGIGINEMTMPLIDALAEHALNNPEPPVIVANLKDAQNYAGMVTSFVVGGKVIKGKGTEPKIGVVGVVGPSVVAEVRDPNLGFLAVKDILHGVRQQMQPQKPEFPMLLYQGSAKEAAACAQAFPEFQVILALSKEEEPPEQPDVVGKTHVVQVGWKGREIGLIGIYRTAKADAPFELYYQLVPIGPEYETPPGRDNDNPIMGLLEKYAQEVKKGNYLAHYSKSRHPIQLVPKYAEARYVGTEKCKKCHEASYKVWMDSPHSHSYDTLVKAKRPALRQFDGECVACHVTGFKYATGFANEKDSAVLIDNGCENCHGPGSMHIKNKNDAELHKLMNPLKEPPNEQPAAKQRRMELLNRSCIECHDSDNDVHWDIKKWDKIVHKEPNANPPPNAAAPEDK